jgi:hypothetical protein
MSMSKHGILKVLGLYLALPRLFGQQCTAVHNLTCLTGLHHEDSWFRLSTQYLEKS